MELTGKNANISPLIVMNHVTLLLSSVGFMDDRCTCLRGDKCGEFPETDCFCVLKYGSPVCIPSTYVRV